MVFGFVVGLLLVIPGTYGLGVMGFSLLLLGYGFVVGLLICCAGNMSVGNRSASMCSLLWTAWLARCLMGWSGQLATASWLFVGNKRIKQQRQQ